MHQIPLNALNSLFFSLFEPTLDSFTFLRVNIAFFIGDYAYIFTPQVFIQLCNLAFVKILVHKGLICIGLNSSCMLL